MAGEAAVVVGVEVWEVEGGEAAEVVQQAARLWFLDLSVVVMYVFR